MDNGSNYFISSSKLTKIYGKKVKALQNINITIPKGITALIGPNGAGKSTFLKLLLGLLKPSDGSLTIFGLDSWKDSTKIHNSIGFVNEKHYFPPHLTVKNYLSLISDFFSSDFQFETNQIIKIPMDRKISSLSAGMHRKLCLIQCFLGQPKLIVMDEPTANLDPIARKELLFIIKDIHQRYKIDFIISSHILSDLESIASNVVVLNKGEIKFIGKYSELISTYFSYNFEIYVDKIDEWKSFLNFLGITKSIAEYDNKLIFTVKDKVETNEILKLIFCSPEVPKSNVNLFRKILDIEEIFR